MSNFWDNDSVSEWETVEETLSDQAQAVLDEFEDEDYEEEYYEEDEYMEDYKPQGKTAYKLDRRESNILNDATIRLEQARLYDMLIKHDLFHGVKANPRALANVQNELKAYIVSRLEILLGIREEKKAQEPKQIVVESPFNDVEIEFLKALSYKGTKGASAQAKPKTLSASEITPLSSVKSEPQGLKPLSNIEEDEEEIVEETHKPIKKRATPKKPVKTKKTRVKRTPPESIRRRRRGQMTDAEAEEIARKELKNTKGKTLNKHPYEMTAKELKELAKSSSRKTRKTKEQIMPEGYVPPITSAQNEMLIQQQQLQNNFKPGSSGVSLLVQKIIKDKNNK